VTFCRSTGFAAYARSMRQEDDGGAVTKVLVTVMILAVLLTAALFAYVRVQEPIALGDATVGVNRVLEREGGGTIAFRAGGQIYVATTLRNAGRLPVTLQGLGEVSAGPRSPYVPVDLLLGDGATADPRSATPFTPFRLDAGEGVGVLVGYAVNPDLVCKLLPTAGEQGVPEDLEGFSVRTTTYGVEQTQALTAETPFATVAPATRAECERALGATP
jgi:hypothetical protein